MASPDSPKRSRCTGSDVKTRGTVHLAVLDDKHKPRGIIRRSKSGKRRAIVLAVIQVLIIAHVIQWYITGRTTTPIEPSEAMEFGKQGVINAGLIFFVLALLSTLVFGRWFCGWGCHLVMLQDLCGWIMKKFGVRPKPFRSRLLLYVPLILALYMFVWPAFYRL
ncbi:MAG: 4Fe-4S binding protein, partial [Phycisphaerales bacterium]